MEGFVDVKQFKRRGEHDFEKECDDNMKLFQDIVRKLVRLIEEPPMERWHVDYQFGKDRGRHEKSFSTICLFISLYVDGKDEFIRLSGVLWKCYQDYLNTECGEYEPILEEEETIK